MKMLTVYMFARQFIIVSVCVCWYPVCSQSAWMRNTLQTTIISKVRTFQLVSKPHYDCVLLWYISVKNKTIIQRYSSTMAFLFVCLLLCIWIYFCYVYFPLKMTCRFLNTINQFFFLLAIYREEKFCGLWALSNISRL